MQRIPQIWPGWQAETLIGEGGFGKVYRASHTVGGHTSHAAIKVIKIPRSQSEIAELAAMGMDALSIRSRYEGVARTLMREIALMDTLKGAPNIVHIEDYQLLESTDGVGWNIYIRMELLEALPSRIEKTGLPSIKETARMGVDLCKALERCHQIGVIHRDVKPDNVFCSAYGEYKLGDFGLARRIEQSTNSEMTQAGTNGYMAPEVQTGSYDHRVDIYSLGMMLYRYLNNGRPAFIDPSVTPTRADLDRAMLQQRSGQRPPLPAGKGVPAALASIVHHACEPRPEDRWGSAAQFGEALQSWLDGSPVSIDARPAATTPRAAATPKAEHDYLSDMKKVQSPTAPGERAAATSPKAARPQANQPAAAQTVDEASRKRLSSILSRATSAWRAYVSVVDWNNGDATGWAMSSEEFQQARSIFNSLIMELMTIAPDASGGDVSKARTVTEALSAYCDVNERHVSARERIQYAQTISQTLGTPSIDGLMEKAARAKTAPEPAAAPAQRPAAAATPTAAAPQKPTWGDRIFNIVLWLIGIAVMVLLPEMLGPYALPVLGVACVLIFLFTRNDG